MKGLEIGGRPDARGQVTWRPASVHAIRLLGLVLGEGRAWDVLPRLTAHVSAIKATVSAALDKPDVQQPGARLCVASSALCNGSLACKSAMEDTGIVFEASN